MESFDHDKSPFLITTPLVVVFLLTQFGWSGSHAFISCSGAWGTSPTFVWLAPLSNTSVKRPELLLK